ncbi:GlxA family transcriptional regulator [Mesorhizobium sp. M0118]|uniref:GlxA family transcriptional regulator n=1 Tax=Mesorhizobium sp. M0118 TaxID=2956884 RepID=UPI003335EECE
MFDSLDQPIEIDIVAFPETTLILIAAVIEPLRAANRIAGKTLYSWRFLSIDGRPAETTSQLDIAVSGPFLPSSENRPLFILSSYSWEDYSTLGVKMALSRAARHRPMIAGIESGTWLVAEAGLLNHHKVALHWDDHKDFSERYPDINVVQDRFVIDRKRMTSGGALPTLDMMLEIIRRRQNFALAFEVSRSFVYQRDGASHQLISLRDGYDVPMDDRLIESLRLMEQPFDQPLTIARIARRVGTSDRHLQTLFQNAFGVTPHQHYLALRLNFARRQVIESRTSLADIAVATGFNSASAFSRSYRAQFRESPSETRRRLRTGG